jgi:hypothetical protein
MATRYDITAAEQDGEAFGTDEHEAAFGECIGTDDLFSLPSEERLLFGLDDGPDAFGFSFKKLVRGVKKGVSKVVNNPIVRVVAPMVPAAVGQGPMFELGAKVNPGVAALKAGGAAFVAPKGAPPALAIAAADRIVRAGSSPVASLRAAAQGVVARTQALAKRGDPDAKRAVTILQQTATMRKAVTSGKPPPGKVAWRIYANGRVEKL